MTKYLIEGGGHIQAASPLEIVEALRQDAEAWQPSVSIEDYMESFADRSQLQTGRAIRTDSVEAFVEDLLQEQFIVPVA